MNEFNVTIVGGGLAGAEAALTLATYKDINVKLYEMRPNRKTEVHKTDAFGELVCSNSFKSLKKDSAAGMLKYELASLGSELFECALNTRVDAGNALAVDRERFSSVIGNKISSEPNIEVIREEVVDLKELANNCDAVILATGPLTSDSLAESLQSLTGESHLSFFDAAAPIVLADTLNTDKLFFQDRYDEDGAGDYLNSALNKSQYEDFISALKKAECVIRKDFESKDLFQACQPIEEIARSGDDAPRFGPMKPVGIVDKETGERPYAVVQLRAENKQKTAYNLVGFQTNLKFNEQDRLFRRLPGLEKAEFVKYGVMHRNTFINAPKLLDKNLRLKDTNIFVAGQLSGTEGYLEAVRSGHHAALSVVAMSKNVELPNLSKDTAFGALISYATDPDTKNYQPMHVNFGLLSPLETKVRNKKDRYSMYVNRGTTYFDAYMYNLENKLLLSYRSSTLSNYLKNSLEKLWIQT